MSAVATFYRFVELTDLPALRDALFDAAAALKLRGTILLAGEGINGTLSGTSAALQAFAAELGRHQPLVGLRLRVSGAAAGNPVFHRLKVRIKPEIVRFGQGDLQPGRRTGERVGAERFNALLDDPQVLVLDARNSYEIAVGTFPGALDPGTRSFRELPAFVRERLDPNRHRRVAMFCTGGIRCEKASAWMLEQGFSEVYQLDGGIIDYLAEVHAAENRWHGECFVFDQRVALDPSLEQGSFSQCHACRRPLSVADTAHPAYVAGESCRYCIDQHDAGRRAGFRERRRQVALAAARGKHHLGGDG